MIDVAGLLANQGMRPTEAERKAALADRAVEALHQAEVADPGSLRIAWVPGRLEVLGKHTDYAGGRSLLAAADRGFVVVAAPREDRTIRVVDAGWKLEIQFPFSPEIETAPGQWSNYPMTVARRLARNFPDRLTGVTVAIVSDLPPDAGMSSSSALLVSLFWALAAINRLEEHPAYRSAIRTPEDLAGYLACVENGRTFGPLIGDRGVGTFGGSEDHTAMLCCRAGALSQYAFCPVRHERTVTLPEEWVFVVASSGIAAQKTGAALYLYNRASGGTARMLELWRTATGRDDPTLAAAATAFPDAPDRMRRILADSLDPEFQAQWLLGRFDQFLDETARIIPAVTEAIAAGAVTDIGPLVDASQRGAETGIGNQIPETSMLARTARELGATAASAFGAGFGGSVWALVRRGEEEEFTARWSDAYRRWFPQAATRAVFLVTRPGPPVTHLA